MFNFMPEEWPQYPGEPEPEQEKEGFDWATFFVGFFFIFIAGCGMMIYMLYRIVFGG